MKNDNVRAELKEFPPSKSRKKKKKMRRIPRMRRHMFLLVFEAVLANKIDLTFRLGELLPRLITIEKHLKSETLANLLIFFSIRLLRCSTTIVKSEW